MVKENYEYLHIKGRNSERHLNWGFYREKF